MTNLADAHDIRAEIYPGRVSQWIDRYFRYVTLTPALLFLLLIGAFPLIYNLVVSMQGITMLDPDTSFQGMKNYERLLSDNRFWEAVGHTLFIAAIALPIQLVAGVLLATFFRGPFPGKRLIIALLVLPAMIAPIVAGASIRLMLDNQYGPVNQVIGWFAGEPVTILWTVDPQFVYYAVIATEVWAHTPFVFLLSLAAFEAADNDLVEAGEIDGATGWRSLWFILLPMIRPVLIMVMLIRLVDIMRLFDLVFALTQGGPGTRTETISIYLFVNGFRQFDISYTAAIAFVVITFMSIVLYVLLSKLSRNN